MEQRRAADTGNRIANVRAKLARAAAHCQGQTGFLRFASAGAARLLYVGMTRARDLLYVTYQSR
jgi:superfamily I DNA/RNA helicase